MWTERLQTHGDWILALGCPLEGETVLILAGYPVHRGLLDPVAVLAIASLSGFAGDQGFFWLGRRHGAGVIARFPSAALGRMHSIEGRLLAGLFAMLLAAALVRAVLHRRAARAARAVQAGQPRQRAGARAP